MQKMSRPEKVGTVIGLAGWIVLFVVSWKIALGVFLAMYGNNLQFGYRRG